MMYTREMRKAVHSFKVPVDGFRMDVVEYDSYPPFLALQFYRSQWSTFSDNEKIKCLEYLVKVKTALELYGCRVTIDPILDLPT